MRSKRYHAAVLARAAHLFLEHGYGATSDASIYTGIASKGWFYSNFREGKVDVARAIMEISLSTEGLQPQRLVTQLIYDIGMLLAYKITVEEEYLAALKLSFDPNAKHYGGPWEQWVAFNTAQLREAQDNGEIMKHISPEAEARQIPASWSGQVQITLAVDGNLDNLHTHMNRVYRNWLGGMVNRRILAQVDLDPLRGMKLYDAYVLGRDSTTEM